VRTESFNPRTLFLFGTYTIGKERLFLEVARAMGKKVGVRPWRSEEQRVCGWPASPTLPFPATLHGLGQPASSPAPPPLQVYVSAAKRAVMDCLELAPEYRALITSDHLETNIHAVRARRACLPAARLMRCGPEGCRPWHTVAGRAASPLHIIVIIVTQDLTQPIRLLARKPRSETQRTTLRYHLESNSRLTESDSLDPRPTCLFAATGWLPP
jgi:hypothetical protein